MIKEPLIKIEGGIKIDTYQLSTHIKNALKNIEFDLIIDNISIIPRKKIKEQEKEENKEE